MTDSTAAAVTVYSPAGDEAPLRALLQSEGFAWADYHSDEGWERYRAALRSSTVYVLRDGGELCGLIRVRDDDGFGVYVYDLLVHKDFRGRNHGRALLERVRADYPYCLVFVLSDSDGFYEKNGCRRVGSIFEYTSRGL